jgi:hypothetical protein
MTAHGELARPEFESVDLTIDTETTETRIEETVKGLAAAEADGVVNYRTRGGTLVAVVGAPTEREGTTFAYRTAPAADPATRKASRLREAVDDAVVE